MGAAEAVALATRVNEVGFSEFTAKLINDVFDAVISANISQTEAYVELVNGISKTLTQFIADNKDSIGGDLILQFLNTVVPDQNSETGTKVTATSSDLLTNEEANNINNAIKVIGVQETDVADTSTQISDLYEPIIDAIAGRIAADKFAILKEMVKLGVLRLVVEEGEIETKLTFTTYGSNFYETNRSKYNRKNFEFGAKAKTGGFLSKWVSASAATKYSSVNVTAANSQSRDTTGSTVQIYGGVKIKFKTDYQPLLTESNENNSGGQG